MCPSLVAKNLQFLFRQINYSLLRNENLTWQVIDKIRALFIWLCLSVTHWHWYLSVYCFSLATCPCPPVPGTHSHHCCGHQSYVISLVPGAAVTMSYVLLWLTTVQLCQPHQPTLAVCSSLNVVTRLCRRVSTFYALAGHVTRQQAHVKVGWNYKLSCSAHDSKTQLEL